MKTTTKEEIEKNKIKGLTSLIKEAGFINDFNMFKHSSSGIQ